jgi:class 3 adenylate cyclase/alpha-beta hydrolase superfamily lysophospholipase
MSRPPTRFVSVGRDRVAYVVWGDGPTDALFLQSFGASVDAIWEHPGHLRWSRALGARLRVVMLDHRGSGVSDSAPDARQGDLDDRIEDVCAVLDGVGLDRVSVIAEADGALTAIKFAVEHPERIDKLVLLNGYAAGAAAPFLGAAQQTSPEHLEELADSVRGVWGSGELVAGAVPHFGDDLDFCARFERIGARPSAAAALVRNLATVDVRGHLDKITAPTLVVYSGDMTLSTVEQSRELSERIPAARLFEGSSSTFYWGSGVVKEFIAFISGADSGGDRDLVTLLFTDVVDSTRAVVAAGDDEWRQTLNFLDDLVAARISRAGGRIVKQTGDGHLIEFARPGNAVDAAIAICRAAPTLGVTIRAGIHTGEIERRENGDIGGLTVHIAARVASSAGAGQVVVSRTVADLLGATEYPLRDHGEHELKGVPGRWALFAVDP